MYYGSETGGRCCIRARQTFHFHSLYHKTFLSEMTSRLPFWNFNVQSKIEFINRCVFTWRTILPNFIPIRLEMTEPQAFMKRSPQQKKNCKMNKMSSEINSWSRIQTKTLYLECCSRTFSDWVFFIILCIFSVFFFLLHCLVCVCHISLNLLLLLLLHRVQEKKKPLVF